MEENVEGMSGTLTEQQFLFRAGAMGLGLVTVYPYMRKKYPKSIFTTWYPIGAIVFISYNLYKYAKESQILGEET